MRRQVLATTCTILFIAAGPARAGHNSGASVELTWDAAVLSASPAGTGSAGFPLCVTVRDAPDLRQLAIRVDWSPRDPRGDCIRVTPIGRASACGVARPPRIGTIRHAESYTWAVLYDAPPRPPPRSPQYLVYWVTGTTCDSTAFPRFTVTDARAMDSSGASDKLVSQPTVVLNGPVSSDPRADQSSAAAAVDALPTRLALYVHPNPSTGAVMIRFDLPAPMASALALYDVRGALVRITEPAVKAQRGVFRWELDGGGRRVRPGIYFARLTTPAGVRVAPVTVLR